MKLKCKNSCCYIVVEEGVDGGGERRGSKAWRGSKYNEYIEQHHESILS